MKHLAPTNIKPIIMTMLSVMPIFAFATQQTQTPTDGLVLQVSKAGIINPNHIGFVPFTGNLDISRLTIIKLNQTSLKTSDDKLPAQPKSVDEVLNNIHAWRNTGYQYVVIGDGRTLLGRQAAITFQVIDLQKAKVLDSPQTHIFNLGQNDLQTVANTLSHKIYQTIMTQKSDLMGRIAYVEETKDTLHKTSALKIMDVATQAVHTIDTIKGAILSPAFSADGTQIAYTAITKDALPVIYLYQSDSQTKKLVTPFKGNNLSPAFSPDGQALLFSGSHENNNPNIYHLDLKANKLSAITTLEGAENSPSYLSKQQIIFTADHGSRTQTIYQKNIHQHSTGTSFVRIGTGSNPKVSADGSKIAYTQNNHLIVSNLDGSNQQTVANVGTEGMASFSPSGNSIVYVHQDGTTSQLVIKNLTDGTIITLPTKGIIKDPVWSASTDIKPAKDIK